MLTQKNSISSLLSAIHIVTKRKWEKLSLILLFLSFGMIAQTNFPMGNQKQFYKVISFGEKIDFGNVENTATWTITNTQENVYANLRGKQINDYVFEKPGIYEIRFSENKSQDADECHHPMFKENMNIKVTAVKMTFDFSKIKFSEKIQKGRYYNDLLVSVPVTILTQGNVSTKQNAPGLNISGIGSELIAKPTNTEIIIKNGVQILQYQLSGMVTKDTYLMFDFFDLNNEVQTYNLLDQVN